MKLEQNNWINVTTLFSYVTENSCFTHNLAFWGILGFWGIFGPKIDHLPNISESFHYVFLISCMKLEQNKWHKCDYRFYVTENSCLPINWAFWGIFASNIDHLLDISESFHYVFLIFCMKLEAK